MKNNDEDIEIRALYENSELEQVRALEAKIWGEHDSIPTHQTITAVKNGGLVLGAFSDGQLIAFQYSFPGFNGQTVYLCSHILATLPEYRNKGIGEKLKYAQREAAYKLGYELITWTYDPLESINGYLNIGKLGGRCSSYISNCYGEMEDLLNKGIPSDRFLVHWQTLAQEGPNSSIVCAESDGCSNTINSWEVQEDGLVYPGAIEYNKIPNLSTELIYVAIPKNFREIRETNHAAALSWRMQTRKIFTHLFQCGWEVTGYQKNNQPTIPVNFYVLTKREG
ncbi:GNAT family N-acetyltransferase [Bacillus sp. T3]|uniref:GNAT family N-acetyltransferase n=1 Tax=Bacillus sp. T3 TaxID=467262 RepID=UPI0029819872|nr:GNAT family N-acetyltransferase [Bacillus sp. T3]